MGCLVPEEYGGNAMGLLPMALAIDEMGARGFGNALMVVTAMDAATSPDRVPEAFWTG